MACERYRDALTDAAAGAPAPAEVEAHLATCGDCRAEIEALRRALAAADTELAGLAAAEPSPELAVRIRHAAAEAATPAPWRFGWLWPAAAAAATLLVALAVWVGRAPAPVIPRDTRLRHDGGEALSVGAGSDARRGSAIAASAPTRAAVGAESGEPLAVRTAGPDEQREVRRAGGSLGTRQDGVHRDGTPEVLVPPGEAEALLRFATLVHRDRHAPATFLAAGQPSGDLPELAALAIEPLEIVPLDPAETSGT